VGEPFVSIIITAYNYGRFLGTAIESALRQRYARLEVLVLDNASTDDTSSVIARYAHDPRLRAVRNERNIGLTPNHNKGLEIARGELIGFLSADDALAPDFVAHAVRFYHEHPDVDVLYGGAYFMDEAARVLQPRAWPGQPEASYAGGRNELAELLAEGAYMCQPTMLVPRAIWERFGPFDAELVSADWELASRWAYHGVRFGFDPEPFAYLRLHAEQNSGLAKHNASGREMRDYVTIFDRYLDAASPERYAGHEVAIRRVIDQRDAYFRTTFGAPAAAEFDGATERFRQRIDAIAAANRDRSRDRLAFVVVAGESVGALQVTLESLAAQPDRAWRAVVVQDAGPSSAPLCSTVDPARIRHVRLPDRRTLATALRTAVTIEEADLYVVLRAGARVGPGHAGAVRAAFIDPMTRGALCTARVIVDEADVAGATTGLDVTTAPPVAIESMAFARTAFEACGFRDVPLPEWDFLIRLTLDGPLAAFTGDVAAVVRPGMRNAGLADADAVDAVASTYRTFPVTDLGRLAARAAFSAALRAAHAHDLRTVEGVRACYATLAEARSLTSRRP